MRNTWILVAVGVVALFFVACGGGGGGETPTGGGETPTSVPVVEGELIQVTGTADLTFEPSILELKVGKPYKVQFLNRSQQGMRLEIARWAIRLFALAGQDSPVSNVFVPDEAGDYECVERLQGAQTGMRCIARVSQ